MRSLDLDRGHLEDQVGKHKDYIEELLDGIKERQQVIESLSQDKESLESNMVSAKKEIEKVRDDHRRKPRKLRTTRNF